MVTVLILHMLRLQPHSSWGCDWAASIGAVPFVTSFYGDANGFAVTNVGVKATKDLKITDSFLCSSLRSGGC